MQTFSWFYLELTFNNLLCSKNCNCIAIFFQICVFHNFFDLGGCPFTFCVIINIKRIINVRTIILLYLSACIKNLLVQNFIKLKIILKLILMEERLYSEMTCGIYDDTRWCMTDFIKKDFILKE